MEDDPIDVGDDDDDDDDDNDESTPLIPEEWNPFADGDKMKPPKARKFMFSSRSKAVDDGKEMEIKGRASTPTGTGGGEAETSFIGDKPSVKVFTTRGEVEAVETRTPTSIDRYEDTSKLIHDEGSIRDRINKALSGGERELFLRKFKSADFKKFKIETDIIGQISIKGNKSNSRPYILMDADGNVIGDLDKLPPSLRKAIGKSEDEIALERIKSNEDENEETEVKIVELERRIDAIDADPRNRLMEEAKGRDKDKTIMSRLECNTWNYKRNALERERLVEEVARHREGIEERNRENEAIEEKLPLRTRVKYSRSMVLR